MNAQSPRVYEMPSGERVKLDLVPRLELVESTWSEGTGGPNCLN